MRHAGHASVSTITLVVTTLAAALLLHTSAVSAQTCTSFTLSPSSASMSAGSGWRDVTMTGVPAGCSGGAWTADGNGSWVTVSAASGTGPGTVRVSWTANGGGARSGAATLAGQVFTVNQAAAAGAPSGTIVWYDTIESGWDSAKWPYWYPFVGVVTHSYSPTHSLFANGPGTLGGDFATTVGINISGLTSPTLRFRHRYSLAVGQVAVVQVHTAASGWTLARQFTGSVDDWTEAVIDLSPWLSAGTVALRWGLLTNGTTDTGWYFDDIYVHNQVAGVPCTSYTLTPASASPTAAAGQQAVTITGAPAGCTGGTWTAAGNGSWLTVSPTGGTASGTVTVSWAANTTGAGRSANATIAGQAFAVTQAGACTSFAITPTTATASPAAGLQAVTITGAPAGCTGGTWTAAGNGSWLSAVPPSGTGPGGAVVSWTANTGTASRVGEATIAGRTFSVTQRGVPDASDSYSGAIEITALPYTGQQSTLAATSGGEDPVVPCGSFSTYRSVWYTVTVPSSGELTVDTLGSSYDTILGLYAGTPGAFTSLGCNDDAAGSGGLQSRVTIDVQAGDRVVIFVSAWTDDGGALTLHASLASTAPFGLVDTPLQATTGVVGSIGVTGWALDDTGIVHVRLYRDCLSFEPAINCATVAGRQVVYIGDATRVVGARPDVEAVYPSYHEANKAAWGYLLLTPMLPHGPNQLMFGGQGPLTLHVLVTDVDGGQTWLGRTVSDATPTTVTLSNDTIAKPFGAIDTPAQGETRGGAFWNFGWVLTPDANTTSGEPADIVMPIAGNTIQVYIDGVPWGTPVYNLCRGTSPTPAYCDDDVANIFGNPTPLPTFTVRTANPTKFRNLDAGRGAIGGKYLDTTALANGIHTIAWGVSDSAGRGEGIGSRYFWVANGAGDQGHGVSAARPGGPEAAADRPATPSAARVTPPPAAVDDAEASGDAAAPGAWDRVGAPGGIVRVRTGFGVKAPWTRVAADEDGVYRVALPELGRLELDLGRGIEHAGTVVGEEVRDLPVGSRLDRTTGRLTWTPGPGFLGTYRLAFQHGGGPTFVEVTVGHTPAIR